jgi:hypothetical protein
MAATIGGSSGQSTDFNSNSSTVAGYGSITITAGSFSGQQSYGYVTIGGVTYTSVGPTAMSAGQSWNWSASRGFGHDINGYRGDVGVSVEFFIDGSGQAFHGRSTGAGTQGAINFDRKPASVTGASATVNTDKSATVSFSGGASPGGSPTLSSTYHVSYSQNGGGFTGDYTGSGSPITVPAAALTPGSNYVFRVWATNGSNDGASASSDSSSVFVSSGGKIYNGTAWVPTTTAKIYNGTAWVDLSTAKIYNGTSWVNLT